MKYSDKSSDKNSDFSLEYENFKLSKVSGSIQIDGNSGWISAKNAGICTGSGTYFDPYVIEDLEINAKRMGSCILIENSYVHFKIENCTLFNARTQFQTIAGIYFNNVVNGKIINNNCSINDNGIYLYQSYNNEILNNTANSNEVSGINLEQSSNNVISGNIVKYNTNDGIKIVGSSNTISGNIVIHNGYFEIHAFYAHNNVFSENTAHAIILYVTTSNILSGNKVSNGSGIVLFDSNNTNIFNNIIYNNWGGIKLLESYNNKITGNTASNNNDHGIHLEKSHYNTVSGNTASNSNYGIFLTYSRNNHILLNTITDNGIGIHIYKSKCNQILNNSFSGNDIEKQGTQEECDPFPLEIVLAIVIPIVGITLIVTGMVIYKRKKSRGTEIKYPKKEGKKEGFKEIKYPKSEERRKRLDSDEKF